MSQMLHAFSGLGRYAMTFSFEHEATSPSEGPKGKREARCMISGGSIR